MLKLERGGYQMSDWEVYSGPENESSDSEWEVFSPEQGIASQIHEGLSTQHPYLMKLAEVIQRHPNINRGLNAAAPWAEHFNRATEGTGLPGASRNAFSGASDLLRFGAGFIPTGVAPKVDIPDPGWRNIPIEQVNPKIQSFVGAIGDVAPYFIGGAPQAAEKAAVGAASKIPVFTNKGLANKITKDAEEAQKIFSGTKGKYGQIFKQAEEAGIKKIDKPKANIDIITKNTPANYHQKLLEFIKNPTIENAHWAQSDLGKAQRVLEKKALNQDLTSHQYKVLNEIKSLKDKIKDNMFSKAPHLKSAYEKTGQEYLEQVIPYTTNKSLNLLRKGEMYPEVAIKNLGKNAKFMNAFGKKYPGMQLNKFARTKLGQTAIGSILSGLGLGAGYDVYKYTIK